MNLVELARAFPGNEFHGFELSQHALQRARENTAAAAAGGADMSTVQWHDVGQADDAGSLETAAGADADDQVAFLSARAIMFRSSSR